MVRLALYLLFDPSAGVRESLTQPGSLGLEVAIVGVTWRMEKTLDPLMGVCNQTVSRLVLLWGGGGRP